MLDDAQPDESTDIDDPPKHPHGNNRGLKQAYELRDLAAQQALALKDGPLAERETMSQRAQALASLVKAWDYASDRLRIMRNRPLPGSLRPEKPSKKVARVKASPVESAVESAVDSGSGNGGGNGNANGEAKPAGPPGPAEPPGPAKPQSPQE